MKPITNSQSHAILAILTAVLVAAVPQISASQLDLPGLDDAPVTLEGFASLTAVPQGGTVQLAIVVRTSGHWHVNAHETNDEFLIPTTVELQAPPGLEIKGVIYPDGIEKNLSFSDNPMRLYQGDAYIGVIVEATSDIAPDDYRITAAVTYQACDNEKCLAPETENIYIPLRVSGPSEAIDAAHSDIFSQIDFTSLTASGAGSAGGSRLGAIVEQRGFFIAFLLVFAWGLALNLTPCVYPMIPITVGYFGGQSGGRKSGTLGLALLYVLGMAAMYSTLGLIAALTGSLLGTALQSPIVIAFVALVLVGLAMSMFGFYEIRVPTQLTNLAGASQSKQGAVGAFLMGLTVGIVAAPCIGPLVLALLTFVGESGSPVLGFTMFFTLALGLGFPFIFLAMLSGNISKLPKSGEWMEWVKKLFGLVMLAMAVYFLQPLLSDAVYWGALGMVLVIGGVLLGFIKRSPTSSLFFSVFQRFIGVAAPLFGLYLMLTPGHIIARAHVGIEWAPYDVTLLETAERDQRYVLIDFSADWCLPCKELDHKTFSPPEVIDATSNFVTLKADLTKSGSTEVAGLRKKFAIRGVPTVVFIDKNGRERTELRIFGFVDKDEFLKRLGQLKSGT